jgi:hypothetical protein
MKQDPITKLYKELSNKELAALSLNYLTQENPDELELARIKAAVPIQNYRGMDQEFHQHLDTLTMMICLWTITRLKVTTHMLTAGIHWTRTLGNL